MMAIPQWHAYGHLGVVLVLRDLGMTSTRPRSASKYQMPTLKQGMTSSAMTTTYLLGCFTVVCVSRLRRQGSNTYANIGM